MDRVPTGRIQIVIPNLIQKKLSLQLTLAHVFKFSTRQMLHLLPDPCVGHGEE
jgi:hypothetical protein